MTTLIALIGLPVYLAAQSQDPIVNELNLGKLTTLLRSLQERTTELDKQAEALKSEENRLNIMEREVQAQVEKYTKIRKEIKEITAQHKTAKDTRVRRLAKMFEAMPPKKPVSQIAKMDHDIVLELFTKIKEKKAALILSEMNPITAAKLGTRLIEDTP